MATERKRNLGHNEDEPRYPVLRQTYNDQLIGLIRKVRKMPCLFTEDGVYRPNVNICVAEGCFGKACFDIIKEN